MSHLVSLATPITGAHTVKQYAGFGILGADIPTTGDNGGSVVLNDSIDPTKEYHWRVVSQPSAGTLTIYPDMSSLFEGAPDGTYNWTYQLFEGGISQGTAGVTETIGSISEQVLSPSLYSNEDTFYAHVVYASKTLVGSLYSGNQSFYSPLLSPGTLGVTPEIYNNAQEFYTPIVSIEGGPQQLTATLLVNAQEFYSPSLSTGAVVLTPILYENPQTFYSLSVAASNTLDALQFTNNSIIYEPIVSIGEGPQSIIPLLFVNTHSFFANTVVPGSVLLTPNLFVSESVFYSVSITNGVVTRFVLRLPSSITTELSEVSSITTSINLISEIESGES